MKDMTIEQIKEIIKEQVKLFKNDDDIHTIRSLAQLDNVKFWKFSYDKPFKMNVDDKIFFTYSDHYEHNSGFHMSVASLHKPNMMADDRGYITGCATNLKGFVVLSGILLSDRQYDDFVANCCIGCEVTEQISDMLKDAFAGVMAARKYGYAIVDAKINRLAGVNIRKCIKPIR